MTARGLRETNISKFFEYDHAPSANALRTSHHSFESFKKYMELHRSLRLRQQPDLFSLTPKRSDF